MYNKVSTSYQKKHFYNFEDEPPEKKLVSDADIFIKELGEKQRNTKTNLEEFLTVKKEFYKANEFISLTNYTSGSNSLKEFNAIVKSSEDVEKLKSHGLADDEIKLLSDYHRGSTYFNAKHKNINRNVLEERLQHIFQQINSVNNESKKCSDSSRLDTELILAEKPKSIETKLLKFALENQHRHKEKLPHPMDNLKNLEEQFNKTTSPVNIKKVRRKARSLQKQIDKIHTTELKEPKLYKNASPLCENSKWDVKDSTVFQNNCPDLRKNPIKMYTCNTQNYYTIKDNQIIRINPSEKIERCKEHLETKLSLDEIKRIPKFENYSPGEPSKVLYLKNLTNNVTEDDLIKVVGKFTEEEIVSIKIMKGKMRGQAFVEMQSELAAQNVLNQCNGIVLKNKPIIIHFGRGKNG